MSVVTMGTGVNTDGFSGRENLLVRKYEIVKNT